MPTYLRPGVFVELFHDTVQPVPREQDAHDAGCLQRSRWSAAAPTAAFVGACGPHVTEPVRVHDAAALDQVMTGAPAEGYLKACVRGYFANGGPPCYVVPVMGYGSADDLSAAPWADAWLEAVARLELVDDVGVLCLPDLWAGSGRRGPDMVAATVAGVQRQALAYAEVAVPGRLVLLEPPPGMGPVDVRSWAQDNGFDSPSVAVFYPWITTADVGDGLPPCGHVAGVMARAWAEIGPQAGPVGRRLEGAEAVTMSVSGQLHDVLYVENVNVLTGRDGVVAARSARTCSHRYEERDIVSGRVLSFLGRNLESGTAWALGLAASDEPAWRQVEHDVDDLLRLAWRTGALWGARPEDAYCVGALRREPDSSRTLSVEVAVSTADDIRHCLRVVWHLP